MTPVGVPALRSKEEVLAVRDALHDSDLDWNYSTQRPPAPSLGEQAKKIAKDVMAARDREKAERAAAYKNK